MTVGTTTLSIYLRPRATLFKARSQNTHLTYPHPLLPPLITDPASALIHGFHHPWLVVTSRVYTTFMVPLGGDTDSQDGA